MDEMELTYTGIGSRTTPEGVLQAMRELAADLALEGWTMRSGGAQGADTAFFEGALMQDGKTVVYVPWDGFGGIRVGDAYRLWDWDGAMAMARSVHPGWARLKQAVRLLHARNAFQVMGGDLRSPSSLVVCWTPDGAQQAVETGVSTGGTRTAIVLAERNGIEVVNLARPGALERARQAASLISGLGGKQRKVVRQ